TLTEIAGAASKLAFTSASQTLTAGVTSGNNITVTLQDGFGNAATAGSGGVTVNLSTTSAGGVFRDTADTSTITSVSIASGSSGAGFKYKDTVAGTPVLTAAASGLTSATQQEIINAGAAAKLAFTTSPSSATSATAFAIQPVVTIQDSLSNT